MSDYAPTHNPASTHIALVHVDSPNFGDVWNVYPSDEAGYAQAAKRRLTYPRDVKIVELDPAIDAGVEPGDRMRVTGRKCS